jgi:hypothetical protein
LQYKKLSRSEFLAGLAAFFCAENNFRTKEADNSEKLAALSQFDRFARKRRLVLCHT